jgi:murein L,D-transpeptidase YafK
LVLARTSQVLLVLALSLISHFAYSQSSDFKLLPDHKLQPLSLIDVAERYRYTIISELETGNLYVYERLDDGQFLLVETMPTSIGKKGFGKQVEGDNKTPVGVYRVTSQLNPPSLDAFYGNTAYPVNYPNAWDRRKKRTGYGIWLHAEPIGTKEKTRPLYDSNGCVVLSNNDIDKIQKYIDVGYTYIIMTPAVVMVPVEKIRQLRQQIRQRITEWNIAWETLRDEPYLAFYSQDFKSDDKNKAQWDTYKKRIHKLKTFIDVNVSDIGIYAYPDEENLVWVEYYQTYSSSNFRSRGWKRQIWRLEDDNVWRIIYEGGG